MIMEEKPQRLPTHVAVIMDGNGRWARTRNLSRNEGHLEGAESVRAIVRSCMELEIPYLTLYAFSTENWNRPRQEVDFLMEQLAIFLSQNSSEMQERGIRFRAIGRIGDLPAAVRDSIQAVEEATSRGDAFTLCIAINYGARAEITDACRKLCEEVSRGDMAPEDIDERIVNKKLYTSDIPDPDLLIRTGGEMRLSNFLLWQLSYSEIYVTDTLWPDFRENELRVALRNYARRERRFGRIGE